MSELSILIVDDEPDQIELARLHLKKSEPDLIIDIAGSATQALNKVKEKHYDRIILDHVMVNMGFMQDYIILKNIGPAIPYLHLLEHFH